MTRRNDLPAMPECTSCGKCCGPAHVRRDEAKRIRRFLEDSGEAWIVPTADPLRCGFLRSVDGVERCAIYEVRPWVCRAFGVVAEMPCAFFPEAVRISFPADKAIAMGVMSKDARLLGDYFEPGYAARLAKLAKGLSL